MNVSHALVAIDDNDDVDCCSDTIYHSIVDTLGGPQPPHLSIEAIEPSNTPITSTLPELDPLVLKDQRSHERARQRLKKPVDISKSKRLGPSPCSCCRPCNHEGHRATTRSIRGTCSEGKDEAVISDISEDECDCSMCDPTNYGPLTTVPANRSVSILDLVKPQKKGSEKRFEVIDRPRQVLLLDDFTEIDPDKYDLDEWEHIESGTKQRKAAPKIRSYARVVAARA